METQVWHLPAALNPRGWRWGSTKAQLHLQGFRTWREPPGPCPSTTLPSPRGPGALWPHVGAQSQSLCKQASGAFESSQGTQKLCLLGTVLTAFHSQMLGGLLPALGLLTSHGVLSSRDNPPILSPAPSAQLI